MGRKRELARRSRHNIAKRGKGGFTLAELCVVLALVALSSAMIVSFSASTKEFAASNAEEYDFLEDCAIVEEELYKWIAENDVTNEDGTPKLDFSVLGSVILSNGELNLRGEPIEGLDTIAKISIAVNEQENLVKCTIVGSEGREKTLVFALRCINQGGGE